MATYVKNQLYMVPLAELQPDPTHLIHFNGERFLGPYQD
jgi:hypothetical protein